MMSSALFPARMPWFLPGWKIDLGEKILRVVKDRPQVGLLAQWQKSLMWMAAYAGFSPEWYNKDTKIVLPISDIFQDFRGSQQQKPKVELIIIFRLFHIQKGKEDQ